jgi:hypothetical protein
VTDLFSTIEPEPAPQIGRDAPWVRRAILTLFAALIVAVLAGAIGQVSVTSTAQAPAARLELSAPRTVRGGLLFQARVHIRARRTVEHPRLILRRGWLEGMQLSSIEPQPAQESGSGKSVALTYDTLDSGDELTVWLQFQADPTSVGRRPAAISLQDDTRTLATISRTLTVLP